MSSTAININTSQKIKAFYELTKFRLSMTVVFSGAFGYVLAVDTVDWVKVVLFGIAAFATTAAANIINQVIEIDLDKLMKRTANRPLPSGRLTPREAMVFGWLMAVLAIYILFYQFNIRAGSLAILSMLLYGFVYTPAKRIGPIGVAIGAIPGAFPPMIGWIAATNHFGLEPGILFAIQFFWQFPHFWAIAWVLDEDYKRAGFRLLPASGKDLGSAIQIMIYTLFLLPLCWIPYYLGMTGVNSAVIAMVFGILFLAQTFHLMSAKSDKAALQLMFGSFIYLPVVQIAYLLDKV